MRKKDLYRAIYVPCEHFSLPDQVFKYYSEPACFYCHFYGHVTIFFFKSVLRWPCMVDNDPDIETFYWNEADESSSEQKTVSSSSYYLTLLCRYS